MSMHLKPLTPIEEAGLRAHGLPVGTPSQLADAFRLGMAWADKARAESTLAEPKPDADGWIPWVGGECPVNPDALVRVRFADFLEEGGCRACQYQWHRSNPHAPSDIIAYRVAGESK